VTEPRDPLEALRLGDVLTLLAVHRCGSVTAAARELRVTPSQVSKSVARLEGTLREALLARAGRGVVLTPRARELLDTFESVVNLLRATTRARAGARELTIAAPSYLAASLVPCIAEELSHLRLRALEMHPAAIRAQAADGHFHVALTPGVAPFPKAWAQLEVGSMRSGLFASPKLASKLGRGPVTVDALRAVPFLAPLRQGVWPAAFGDDGCPLRVAERTLGHQVDTFAVGLELAARTDQLVFGPVLTARRYVEARRLVEIPVRGWKVSAPVMLTCHVDRVVARERDRAAAAVRAALARL
jgi:DNA-binding transcriptional LysR family regulator